MQKPTIALIPNWIMTILGRAGLAACDLLYIEKVAPHLSKADLIALESLQSQAVTIFGVELGGQAFSFMAHWQATAATSQTAHTLAQVKSLLNEPSFSAELRERLFSNTANAQTGECAHQIINTLSDVVFVVIKGGFYNSQGNAQLQSNATLGALQALYMYMPFNELVQTRLFAKQLESLSG